MNLLLDTHILLWWLSDHPELSERSRKAIREASGVVAVSAATVWEIAIKRNLAKLDMPSGWLAEIDAEGFQPLPVTWDHAQRVESLPPFHRDPFDRLLIAQAQLEHFVLVTANEVIPKYEVECLRN